MRKRTLCLYQDMKLAVSRPEQKALDIVERLRNVGEEAHLRVFRSVRFGAQEKCLVQDRELPKWLMRRERRMPE